ncbi:MAG: tetratricopeptide repeat protein [Planctomycetota bacterium]
MGNFEVAREALTESLSVRDESIGPSADETLENIIMLAEVERDGFGDIESAQAWLDEFDRRRPTDHSDDNPVAVYADMTRGGMALAARDYETAAAAYQRVAEAREGIYGETHSGTLTAWANAAVAYEALDRYDEAEEIYLRVLDIEERMGGKDNPDRLPTAHNLAFLYQSTGRYELAEELFRDTLERCKRVFGPVHPGTLTCTESLASLYRDTDRIEQAVELLESAYNTAAAELGEAAPPIIEMATNLAVMYVEVRRPDDGEALLAVTVPAVRELVPPGHAFLGNSLLKWGTCLAAIGETDSALAKLTEAFEILSDAPGQTQADDAREAADRIASIHETAGNASEATRWRELASGLGAETPD